MKRLVNSMTIFELSWLMRFLSQTLSPLSVCHLDFLLSVQRKPLVRLGFEVRVHAPSSFPLSAIAHTSIRIAQHNQ
jgi:hypothetical protein